MNPGQDLTLEIEQAVAGGRMLSRHNGQVVFVAGAIPGERVRARIERKARQVLFASVTEVLRPSPHRRPVAFEPACGGSVFAHIAYEQQLALKRAIVADALARIGRHTIDDQIPIEPSPEHGYRLRARFHVDRDRIGFFKEGTHVLCDPGPTGQLLPDTVQALDRLTTELGDGGWRGVAAAELAENVIASERVVHAEVRDEEAMRRWSALGPVDGITGLTLTDAERHERRTVYGDPTVTDRLNVPRAGGADSHAEATIVRHAQTFFQGNRYLLPTLVARVAALVPLGSVIDLYAGVGVFAVSLAAGGWPRVVAVEGDRTSAADLEANAKPFGSALTAMHTSVEAFLHGGAVSSESTIIVDPPRTGLSEDVAGGILASGSTRLVYVSCDPPTFARDLRAFSEGGYRFDHLEAFDLFPNTAHVETLAVFVR